MIAMQVHARARMQAYADAHAGPCARACEAVRARMRPLSHVRARPRAESGSRSHAAALRGAAGASLHGRLPRRTKCLQKAHAAPHVSFASLTHPAAALAARRCCPRAPPGLQPHVVRMRAPLRFSGEARRLPSCVWGWVGCRLVRLTRAHHGRASPQQGQALGRAATCRPGAGPRPQQGQALGRAAACPAGAGSSPKQGQAQRPTPGFEAAHRQRGASPHLIKQHWRRRSGSGSGSGSRSGRRRFGRQQLPLAAPQGRRPPPASQAPQPGPPAPAGGPFCRSRARC